MSEQNHEIATLGGGCFWCLEAVFARVDGVVSVVSGYCGGHAETANYRTVCRGDTGHAEVVRITYLPERISFSTVLEIFFTIHDPTTPNRQGHDIGSQYRSVIFYHSPEQKEIAARVIKQVNTGNEWGAPVVTELLPAPEFHVAEDHHQRYFDDNPDQGYCQIVIAPKVAKLRQHFRHLLKLAPKY